MTTPFLAISPDGETLRRGDGLAAALDAVQADAARRGVRRDALRHSIAGPGIVRVRAGALGWLVRPDALPVRWAERWA